MKEIKYISSSGSGTVINYGSGSASQKVAVPRVPLRLTKYLVHIMCRVKVVFKILGSNKNK
jgi:hypothetical protein